MNSVSRYETKCNVFVNRKGEYVALRNIHLAFGNTAKEIYFVDDLAYAEKFYPHITELKSKDFYHKFPKVLDLIIDNLEVKQVLIVTEHYLI